MFPARSRIINEVTQMPFDRHFLAPAVIVLALALGGAPAKAQSIIGAAAGAHVSTLGVGAELSGKINRFLTVRAGGNYLKMSTDGSFGGLDYDFDVDLASVGAALDVHPLGNGFLVSVGVYWNGNSGELTTSPVGAVTVGGMTFTGSQVGTLTTDVEYNPVAPYIGIGYDGAHYSILPISFTFRIGLFYMGRADVSLSSTGPLSGTAAFEAELRQEEKDLEDDLSKLGFYPAMTIGLKIRF